MKLLEIRDAGTFIPAMAIKICANDSKDDYLLRRAGFGLSGDYFNSFWRYGSTV